jgi:ATP-dependent protease Clp ATPase subunit
MTISLAWNPQHLPSRNDFLRPQDHLQSLDEHIVGNNQVKELLAMRLYALDNHLSPRPRTLLVCGPSGSGKSHIVESLRHLGRGVIHLNATTLVASGINGYKLSRQLPEDVKRLRDGGHASVIVVLDEFDKLVLDGDNDRHTYGASILAEVLTLFESGSIRLETDEDNRDEDACDVMFLCMGAFQADYLITCAEGRWARADYVERVCNGMPQELRGRLTVATVSPLDQDYYAAILARERGKLMDMARAYGLRYFSLTAGAERRLLQMAHTLGLGARGLHEIWECLISHLLFTRYKEVVDEHTLAKAYHART